MEDGRVDSLLGMKVWKCLNGKIEVLSSFQVYLFLQRTIGFLFHPPEFFCCFHNLQSLFEL